MNIYHRLRERLAGDEPPTAFDAEPGDLELLDPDAYDKADVGDDQ